MSRYLFTVNSAVYELTSDMKEYFMDKTTTENTINVWFEGTRLYHEYSTETDGEQTVECEWVDVVDVFQTLQQDAQSELDDAGAKPIVSPKNGVYATDTDDLIDPRQYV